MTKIEIEQLKASYPIEEAGRPHQNSSKKFIIAK